MSPTRRARRGNINVHREVGSEQVIVSEWGLGKTTAIILNRDETEIVCAALAQEVRAMAAEEAERKKQPKTVPAPWWVAGQKARSRGVETMRPA